MRLTAALAAATLAVSVAVPVTLAATVSPAGATAPCDMPLNPDRRTVYRFTDGADTLGFGQLVVQATQEHYHLYCIRFQTGGRTVTHANGMHTTVREGGACTTDLGGRGSGTYTSGPYDTGYWVPDKQCLFQDYSIRSDGRWYTARFMRYNA